MPKSIGVCAVSLSIPLSNRITVFACLLKRFRSSPIPLEGNCTKHAASFDFAFFRRFRLPPQSPQKYSQKPLRDFSFHSHPVFLPTSVSDEWPPRASIRRWQTPHRIIETHRFHLHLPSYGHDNLTESGFSRTWMPLLHPCPPMFP